MTENGLSVRSVKVVTPFALLMRLSPADSKFEKMNIEKLTIDRSQCAKSRWSFLSLFKVLDNSFLEK